MYTSNGVKKIVLTISYSSDDHLVDHPSFHPSANLILVPLGSAFIISKILFESVRIKSDEVRFISISKHEDYL